MVNISKLPASATVSLRIKAIIERIKQCTKALITLNIIQFISTLSCSIRCPCRATSTFFSFIPLQQQRSHTTLLMLPSLSMLSCVLFLNVMTLSLVVVFMNCGLRTEDTTKRCDVNRIRRPSSLPCRQNQFCRNLIRIFWGKGAKKIILKVVFPVT